MHILLCLVTFTPNIFLWQYEIFIIKFYKSLWIHILDTCMENRVTSGRYKLMIKITTRPVDSLQKWPHTQSWFYHFLSTLFAFLTRFCSLRVFSIISQLLHFIWIISFGSFLWLPFFLWWFLHRDACSFGYVCCCTAFPVINKSGAGLAFNRSVVSRRRMIR